MIRTNILMSAGVLALASVASAQTDELYSGAWGATQIRVHQNGSLVRSWSSNGFESVFAITDRVKSFHPSAGSTGRIYDLNGGILGNTPTNNILTFFLDGGTDGRNFNYATTDRTEGRVYRFDQDWNNGQIWLDPQGQFRAGGVTVDGRTGNIWVAERSTGNRVFEYDPAGNLISSFSAPGLGTSFRSIAWEPSTDMLWLSSRDSNDLYRYDKAGNLQQILTISNWTSNSHGMEFAVPAPGAAALLGLGSLVAARRRRA